MKYTARKTSEFGLYGIYDENDKLVKGAPFYTDKTEAEAHIKRMETNNAR